MQIFLIGSPVQHAKAPANPLSTGRPSQQLAGNRPKNRVTWKVRQSFRVATGITFQLQCGRDFGPLSKTPVVLGCANWWLSLVWLGAGASGACSPGVGVSRWPVGFWLFLFPFRGRRPEHRSVGVGILEVTQASQSAFLHGPEHFLRWGCHSMSSCDGVSPIVVRAGAVHPEGVTYTPRKGSSQPPEHRAPSRELGRRVDVLVLGSLHQKPQVGGTIHC